ncbi:MAG: hypothetical protein PCFJNLEI_01617 [Verrucomicrobiae bacterium]|nr:hypothetical protein [Verrucomicrobiae bacterium]
MAEQPRSAPATATAVCPRLQEAARPNDSVFLWTAGSRALTEFLLRAHAHTPPGDFQWEGGPQSGAQTLAEALRDKQTNRGQKTWIQGIFTASSDQRPHPLPWSLFQHKYDSRKDYYAVRLGEAWQHAEFSVFVDGRRVSHADYNFYAEQLSSQSQAWTPAPARLDGTVELHVVDDKRSQEIPILDYGLPLLTGAKLIARVRLNEPSFAYLIWITSKGEVQPIYPWLDYQWESRAACDKMTDLCLPPPDNEGNTRFYPVDTDGGLECIFLLTRHEPLANSFEPKLRQLFGSVGRLAAKTPARQSNSLYHFIYAPAVEAQPRTMRLGLPQTMYNPLARFRTIIFDGLGLEFPVIKAWAFFNARRSKDRN